MKRFAQVTDGTVDAVLMTDHMPEAPIGRVFIEVDEALSDTALIGATYNDSDGVFTPRPALVNRRLTHADVLSLLTPAEWSEMNRFHPDATGVTSSGTPLNDPEVFWAVSVFNRAEYIDLSDPRFGQIVGLLTTKGLLTLTRSQQLQQQMVALAASKK